MVFKAEAGRDTKQYGLKRLTSKVWKWNGYVWYAKSL